MGISICFYVERRTANGWERVPGGERVGRASLEFATIVRGRNIFAALAGYPSMAIAGYIVAPIGEPAGTDPPADASAEILEELCPIPGGALIGSHTLAALLAYDWRANAADDADIMEAVERMKALGEPEDVRCVFALVN